MKKVIALSSMLCIVVGCMTGCQNSERVRDNPSCISVKGDYMTSIPSDAIVKRVLTEDMAPLLQPGEWVAVIPIQTQEVCEGDVIAFHSEFSNQSEYAIQRVVDVFENYEGTGFTVFRTKGDKEGVFLISESQLIGKVL